jgi:hypothetical protein
MTAARLFGSIIVIFILAACGRNPLQSPSALPPVTNTPPLPELTPIFTPETFALVEVNLNVRSGPGTQFEKIGLLVAGSKVTLRGRNSDGSWWQIVYPSAPGGLGWIAAEFTNSDHAGTVPIVPEPTAITATNFPPQPEPLAKATPALTPTAVLTLTTTATAEPPLHRLDLRITPHTIHIGECARLSYELEALTKMMLNGEPLPAASGRGSLVVCPEVNTTYRLSGLDPQGMVVSQTVALIVTPATPTVSSKNGSVLVSTTAGCEFALETLGTANSNLCRFSPDGQRIAAPAADGSLWVIGANGQTFQQVVDPGGRFFIWGDTLWSPEGAYIAFSAVGLDGLGSGVGYYHFATGSLVYLGPDAQLGKSDTAAWPRWTQDGRLIITWYPEGQDQPGVPSLFGPPIYAPDGPRPLEVGTELVMSAGIIGQQIYPWKPGKVWVVGASPSYEVDY